MTRAQPLTSLALYRFTNPETTCEYPYLAVSEDHSVCLLLGNYSLSFEWGLSEHVAEWLVHDFERTGESLSSDFSTMRELCDRVFGGVKFGLVFFDAELKPNRLLLSLVAQAQAEDGPEYFIGAAGSYQRANRETNQVGPVAPAERAILDVCTATFTGLVAQYPQHMKEPPPPRYRSPSSRQPLH